MAATTIKNSPDKSIKILQSKIISDDRPIAFQGELNQFLATHEISKVTYSTAQGDSGLCLFTALVLYWTEQQGMVSSVLPQLNGVGSMA